MNNNDPYPLIERPSEEIVDVGNLLIQRDHARANADRLAHSRASYASYSKRLEQIIDHFLSGTKAATQKAAMEFHDYKAADAEVARINALELRVQELEIECKKWEERCVELRDENEKLHAKIKLRVQELETENKRLADLIGA